jgi:menaquinone-dependent protoporphyrinogen oxidase
VGKVLVAYASWAGSTAEVAEAVGQELRAGGSSVDVRAAGDVKDVAPYSSVVVGAAVRAGRLHGGATGFVDRHRTALSKLPVAYFVVCLTMKDPTDKNRDMSAGFLKGLTERFPEVRPVSVGLFAGAVRCDEESLSKLPLVQRLVLKAMKKAAGDFRDWNAIRAWARELPARFAADRGGQSA